MTEKSSRQGTAGRTVALLALATLVSLASLPILRFRFRGTNGNSNNGGIGGTTPGSGTALKLASTTRTDPSDDGDGGGNDDSSNNSSHGERYCEWSQERQPGGVGGGDEACRAMLGPHVGAGSNAVSFVFLGDSTMRRLASSVENRLRKAAAKELAAASVIRGRQAARGGNATADDLAAKTRISQRRQLDRCSLLEYMGVAGADERREERRWWIPPAGPNEGPIGNGLVNHFCTDCLTCQARMYAYGSGKIGGGSGSGSGRSSFQVEYLPVEFAKDVEVQTPTTRTTQETVAEYLSTGFSPAPDDGTDCVGDKCPPQLPLLRREDRVCVVNACLHDEILHLTDDEYVANVRWYLSLLEGPCGTLVWLSTTSTLGLNPNQNDTEIARWNAAVRRMLLAPPGGAPPPPPPHGNAFYFDVHNASLHAEHEDNLHFTAPFYGALASTLVKLMNLP